MKSQEFLDIKEIRKLSVSEGYKEIYCNEHSSKVISFVKEEAVYYTTLQTIIKINVYYTTGTVGISIIKGQQHQQQQQFFRRNLEIDELKIIFKNPYVEHHNYLLKSEKGQSLSSLSLTSSTDCKQPAKRPRLLEHDPEPVTSHVNPDEEIKDEKSAIQNQMNILKNERDTIDYKIACLQFMLVEIEHECCKEDNERRKRIAHVEAIETEQPQTEPQITATTLTSMPTTAQDNDKYCKEDNEWRKHDVKGPCLSVLPVGESCSPLWPQDDEQSFYSGRALVLVDLVQCSWNNSRLVDDWLDSMEQLAKSHVDVLNDDGMRRCIFVGAINERAASRKYCKENEVADTTGGNSSSSFLSARRISKLIVVPCVKQSAKKTLMEIGKKAINSAHPPAVLMLLTHDSDFESILVTAREHAVKTVLVRWWTRKGKELGSAADVDVIVKKKTGRLIECRASGTLTDDGDNAQHEQMIGETRKQYGCPSCGVLVPGSWRHCRDHLSSCCPALLTDTLGLQQRCCLGHRLCQVDGHRGKDVTSIIL